MTLDEQDIEAVAQRVAQLIAAASPGALDLLEPSELASKLKVSLDYVYRHAVDLGAMRLGDGPRARLRFDLRTAREAMRARKQPPQPVLRR